MCKQFLASIAAILAVSLAMAATAKPANSCYESELGPRRPGWTNSGTWTPDGSELLLIDSLYRAVVRYSPTGRALGTLPAPMSVALKNKFYPSAGKGVGADLILEVGDSLLVLDERYNPKSITNVVGTWGKGKLNMAGLFQWAPLGSGEVIGIGDIQGPSEEQYTGAFLRFPLSNPAAPKVLRSFSIKDPERIFYRTGYPYAATLGRLGYFLSMENVMSIYASDESGNLRRLNAFPAELKLAPTVPAFKNRDDFAPLMAAIEKSTMPAGLYAWEGALYVLSRTPFGSQGTRWSLVKIDPMRDEVTGTSVIPSNADHLTVIPGPREWAFIEKGPVKAWGLQAIPKVLFVPSALLRGVLKKNLCGL